jgi:hypothetical protein
MNTYDMRGFEPDTKPVNPETLSVNQKAVYDSISFPRKMKTLYTVHKQIMPESSVRRILYTLRNKGLSRKTENGKWMRI